MGLHTHTHAHTRRIVRSAEQIRQIYPDRTSKHFRPTICLLWGLQRLSVCSCSCCRRTHFVCLIVLLCLLLLYSGYSQAQSGDSSSDTTDPSRLRGGLRKRKDRPRPPRRHARSKGSSASSTHSRSAADHNQSDAQSSAKLGKASWGASVADSADDSEKRALDPFRYHLDQKITAAARAEVETALASHKLQDTKEREQEGKRDKAPADTVQASPKTAAVAGGTLATGSKVEVHGSDASPTQATSAMTLDKLDDDQWMEALHSSSGRKSSGPSSARQSLSIRLGNVRIKDDDEGDTSSAMSSAYSRDRLAVKLEDLRSSKPIIQTPVKARDRSLALTPNYSAVSTPRSNDDVSFDRPASHDSDSTRSSILSNPIKTDIDSQKTIEAILAGTRPLFSTDTAHLSRPLDPNDPLHALYPSYFSSPVKSSTVGRTSDTASKLDPSSGDTTDSTASTPRAKGVAFKIVSPAVSTPELEPRRPTRPDRALPSSSAAAGRRPDSSINHLLDQFKSSLARIDPSLW